MGLLHTVLRGPPAVVTLVLGLAGRGKRERECYLGAGGFVFPPEITQKDAVLTGPFGGHASPPRSLENILSAAPPLPGEGTRSSVTHARGDSALVLPFGPCQGRLGG